MIRRKPNSHGAGAGGGVSGFFSTLGPPLPPRRLVPPNIHIAKLPGTTGPPALAFLGPREKVSACLWECFKGHSYRLLSFSARQVDRQVDRQVLPEQALAQGEGLPLAFRELATCA